MNLKAVNISKQFLRKQRDSNIFQAVAPLDFVLPEGTVTVLSGSSGSGKSTLLNMLSGLLRPTSGQVLLGETDLYALEDSALSALRGRHIGLIPQGQTALQALTVRENILLPAALAGREEAAAAQELAEQRMQELGILPLADVMPRELSGGELRRMAIARALIRQPEIILADEPTGDLDEENTEIVLSLFRKLADGGCAVLLVTHDAVPEGIGDRSFLMKAGKISYRE